jgi:hypothetical protein
MPQKVLKRSLNLGLLADMRILLHEFQYKKNLCFTNIFSWLEKNVSFY